MKPSVKSKATTAEFSGGFNAGVARTPSVAAGSSKSTSGYAPDQMKNGESTVLPIQTGQNDVHHSKGTIPSIPASKNTQMQPGRC